MYISPANLSLTLEQDIIGLKSALTFKDEQLSFKDEEITRKNERILYLERQLYGRHSEKRLPDQGKRIQ